MRSKETLRKEAIVRRKKAAQEQERAGALLQDRFLATFPPQSDLIIGAYWPLGSEIDPRPLLYYYNQAGISLGLPICNKEEIQGFYSWKPDIRLAKGLNTALEPQETLPIEPNLIILPLLAFGRQGQRLGRGGGYYDRLLDKLRKQGCAFIAVGVGFAAQEMAGIPVLPHDQTLDWVITEKESIKCG